MTLEQKNEIIRLRKKSVGYTAIATQLGISKETVKTFCKRNNMGGIRREMKAESGICPLCGKAVVSVPGHKPKRFCSSECRIEWWKTNPNKCNPNAIYLLFVSSYSVDIVTSRPKMSVAILIFQIGVPVKYHQAALLFQIPHYL